MWGMNKSRFLYRDFSLSKHKKPGYILTLYTFAPQMLVLCVLPRVLRTPLNKNTFSAIRSVSLFPFSYPCSVKFQHILSVCDASSSDPIINAYGRLAAPHPPTAVLSVQKNTGMLRNNNLIRQCCLITPHDPGDIRSGTAAANGIAGIPLVCPMMP